MVLRVLHLVGSPTDELYAELSRLYARDCLAAVADPARYEFHIAHVSPGGTWQFPPSLEAAALAAAEPLDLAAAVDRITRLAPDVMVPQLFCRAGMTHYRALFDLLGVPYPGNPPAVMAIGADKPRAKALVAAAGVRVPAGQVVSAAAEVTLDLPVVVKPADADNSLGVSLVREASELAAAVAAASEHGDGGALVETYVELGREVRCGVLERDGELVCLPLEEYAVDSDTKPIRDHADKLATDEGGDLRLVAKQDTHAWLVDLADPVTASVWEAARLAYRALGCRQYGLFDVRVDPDGTPWFLEASLYCSFARSSVLAVMAAGHGIALTDLFGDAVEDCIRQAAAAP